MIGDGFKLREEYKTVFTSPAGEQVLSHLMRKFNVTSPTFTQGDSHMTAFREGQRHVVLTILKFINKDTSQMAENIKDQIENE
jgi:hypothetical protein